MELRSTSAPTSSSTLANSRARSGSGVHYRHRRRWLVQLFLADGVQLQCAWTSRENLQRTPPDITICPWKNGFQSNFPERNRLMAAISDATVIFEASDTSGSLHQAAECVRLDRWLSLQSLSENPSLRWPKDFVQNRNSRILSETSDILDLIRVN